MGDDFLTWIYAFGGIGAAAGFLWFALTERGYFKPGPTDPLCGACGFPIGKWANWHKHDHKLYHSTCCPRCRAGF